MNILGFGRGRQAMGKDYRRPMGRVDFDRINDPPFSSTWLQHGQGDLNYFSFNYEECLFPRINEDITDAASEARVYADLTPGQRMFHSLCVFTGQVRNGGVSQFFFNSGSLSPHVLEGMRRIGADEMGARFQQELEAASRASSKLKQAWQSWQQTHGWPYFQQYKATLEQAGGDEHFDSWFFANVGPFEQKIVSYITSRPEEFVRFWDDDPNLKRQELTGRLHSFLQTLIEYDRIGGCYPSFAFKQAFADSLLPDNIVGSKLDAQHKVCNRLLHSILPAIESALDEVEQIALTQQDQQYVVELPPTPSAPYRVTLEIALVRAGIATVDPLPIME